MNTKKHFELYIPTDILTPNDWKNFYRSLILHLGFFSKFEITFSCTQNVIRFFISCDKDLGAVSNNLDGIILYPIDQSEIESPKTSTKEWPIHFVTGGNLLDLKEKLNVKYLKNLLYANFKILAINTETVAVKCNLFLKDNSDNWSKASTISTHFPSELLSINLTKNNRYFKKSAPKYLNIEKSLHMMVREDKNAIFKIDTFPYLSHNYYLNLTRYDFDKHSLIIGTSGSGKSKLISLLINRLNSTALSMNYRIIVIDPHASLVDDFGHIAKKKIVTFDDNDNTDLFPDSNTDLSSATELTTTLFKSILNDQYNPRLDKLLRFSLFTLMTAQVMSLENLKRFLIELEYRTQIVEHVSRYIPQNISKFFGVGFNEMRTRNYEETILPLISMVDEMQLQPSLVGESETSLARTIQENFLTVFSLNKISMGEKVTRTIAGLLIQQIFLLAQSRIFGQKLILIIDEVSIVQNPALVQILAEARKFNLTVILTQQYFGQIEENLKKAIFSNVYNYYVFKVSEEDARALEGNLNIYLPKTLLKTDNAKESEIKIKIMTELQPRECLVRVISNGQLSPCIKARTMDSPETVQSSELKQRVIQKILPKKFVENKDDRDGSDTQQTQDNIHVIGLPDPPESINSLYNLLTTSPSQSKKEGEK